MGGINKELRRCPRCGRPRTTVRSTSGYFNIQPGTSHTVTFMQCTYDDCSYDRLRYLVTENPRPNAIEKKIEQEYEQMLAGF